MASKIVICTAVTLFVMGSVMMAKSAPPRLIGDGSSQTTPRQPLFRNCTVDNDCLTGEFCRTGEFPVCTPCNDCTGVHKRLDKGECAKTWHQCGDCIPGYIEVPDSVRGLACREVEDLNLNSVPPRLIEIDDGSSQTTPRPPLFRNCTADEDCLTGEFCRTGEFPVCTRCTDCKHVHKRLDKVKCAKTWHQCGDCLPRYKEFPDSVRELTCREVEVEDLKNP